MRLAEIETFNSGGGEKCMAVTATQGNFYSNKLPAADISSGFVSGLETIF